jgi:hypothetical protein
MHDIQRNVPIPKTHRPEGSVRRKYPFEDLEVGDMFFVPGKTKNTLMSHVSTVGKRLRRKFITRMTFMIETQRGWKQVKPDTEGAIQGIGVWRVK